MAKNYAEKNFSARFWLDFYSWYAIWLSSQAMLRS
jgi:hypothetical protein